MTLKLSTNRTLISVFLFLFLSFVSHCAQPKSRGIPYGVNEKEFTAAILVAEAGGEGELGMKAVMEVIRTRMKTKQQSMYRIVTEKNAFTCYNKWRNNPRGFVWFWYKKENKSFAKAMWIVNNYFGTNLTKGSNYYHEKRLSPFWSKGTKPNAIIGNHKFFAIIY